MSERILLSDGHSIINRAFYGLPDLTNSEGLHTNGVYGFLNILQKTLEEVIANNPQSVADYRGGKEKALGFLVGQTMKAMKGKADPGLVNQMLREMLG